MQMRVTVTQHFPKIQNKNTKKNPDPVPLNRGVYIFHAECCRVGGLRGWSTHTSLKPDPKLNPGTMLKTGGYLYSTYCRVACKRLKLQSQGVDGAKPAAQCC